MATVFRLVLRCQITRGRAAALGAVGAIGVLIGFAIRGANEFNRAEAARGFVDGFGLGLVVPVVALVFAAAALGDLAEDGTLVYLWLRPVPRLAMALAAWAASVSVAIPFAVVPTALAALATGTGWELPLGAAAAAALAVAAYSTLFLLLGLLVQRSLAWGLAYVLIWEGFVARSGTGPARLSVLVYARSVMAEVANFDPPRLSASIPVALAVPLCVAIAALVATAIALDRVEVK